MKVIFTKGLPASGKTTWARQYVEKNTDWVRVSRDDLRNMRGKYWIPKQEKMITLWERMCTIQALKLGHNVIVDATNLNPTYNADFRKVVENAVPEVVIEFKSFKDVPLEECIKRDLKRANSVGAGVITNMYNKYLAVPIQAYRGDSSLPSAIIVDVDGTLAAHTSNRSPYDWNRVKEDTIIESVRNIVNMATAEHKIIIFTGRDGVCEADTKQWLKDNKVYFDEFYIRPEGNQEKDFVIKERLFDNHIKDKYNVKYILDDRPQVIKMWHNKGLFVLNCQQGFQDF